MQVQDAVKIFRSLMHLGHSHEVNQSSTLLRVFTNIIHKNKEKMTTNQLTEVAHMIRQVMLYPVASHLQSRLLNLHQQIREQLELKMFKISSPRLIMMLTQDRFLKDGHKYMNASKEIKGNLVKALMSHLDNIHYP